MTKSRTSKNVTSAKTTKRSARRLAWTNRALADLEAIGDYIARDNPAAARRWVARLIAAAETFAAAPLAGRRVPELGRDDVREAIVRRYRVVYRVIKNRVEILTLFEGHRRFPDDVDASTDDE